MMSPSKRASVLAIDWGSKYVGVAYANMAQKMVFPVGYLMNDKMIFYHLSDLITRYTVKTIVLGWPSRQKDVQEKIKQFMNSLNYIIENQEITIETIEEDYTSVQSGDIISATLKDMDAFKKNAAVDTISAMIILERWFEQQKVTKELTSPETSS